MKKVWKGIVPLDLTNREKKLFAEYYPLAYKIAYNFNASQIGDDVKENIAFNALQRVVKTYDKKRNTKLSTYLYLCITNNLKSELQRLKRLPQLIAEVSGRSETGKVNIFNFIAFRPKATDNYDWKEFETFVERLKEKLNDRRKLILDMLMYPQIHLEEFIKKYKPLRIPKRLSYAIMARVLGNRSIPYIALEIQRIRKRAVQTLEELNKSYE